MMISRGWHFCVFVSIALIFGAKSERAWGAMKASYTAKSWHRFFEYTSSDRVHSGQDNWFFFEQSASTTSNLSGRAQVYGYAGSSRADLVQVQDGMDTRDQIAEAWAGDLYAQLAAGSSLFRVGYQQFAWQEGFAASYTNFINARDNRTSPFENSEIFQRSAPAASFIVSGEHLSAQIVYLPFSQYDIPAPFSRAGAKSTSFLITGQKVEIAKPENFRNGQEVASRFTWAGEGFDVSVLAASIRDRQGYYSLSPKSTLTNIVFNLEQDYVTPFGITSSINFNDYVLRLEILQTVNRRINRLVGSTLSFVSSDETALTLGFDSLTSERLSYSLQHSTSVLNQDVSNLVREKTESLSFFSIKYDLKQDRSFNFSAVYLHADQTGFARASFISPISRRAEVEVAFDGAFGPSGSHGAAIRDLNRIFVQLSQTL